MEQEFTDRTAHQALKALHDPRYRASEEFRAWMRIPENRELYLHLSACREAFSRERSRRASRRRRIAAAVTGMAAAVLLALLAAGFHTDSPVPAPTGSARLFAARTDEGLVMVETEGGEIRRVDTEVVDTRRTDEQAKEQAKEQAEEQPAAPESTWQRVTTPRGKSVRVILGDGTQVWLNAESSLRYPTEFRGAERRVEVTGEACFDVAHDTRHPFVVSADGLETRVLGTRFNVRTYGTEERHVTLIAGSVEVVDTATGSRAQLQPGRQAVLTAEGRMTVREVNTAACTAWTEGFFYFEDRPLSEILYALGRWYNINIDIDFTEESLRELHLNFWAERGRPLEEALELLGRLEKFRADYREGTITITHF